MIARPGLRTKSDSAVRRILLLSFAFPPDNTASAARPGQLFNYLPEYGYQPVVMASTRFGSVQGNGLVHRVPVRSERITVRTLAKLSRVFARCCAPYEDRLDWVPHAATAASRLIRAQTVDAVVSTSPSLTAHFVALRLKSKFGLPWIADFQDPIRDNPARSRRWFYPYDRIIERTLLGHADHLGANTDTVAAAWRARYPQWSDKISVLWNCFDPGEEIGCIPSTPRRQRVLAHIGSLYGGRHPGQLLESMERLGVDPSTFHVRLVGPIDGDILASHGALFERMRAIGLLEFENGLVPREEARRETAAADYLVLLDLNEKPTSFQVPSKLLTYIRTGKPIIAYTRTDSPVERILARSGISYVSIDPLAPAELHDRKVAEFLSIPPETGQPSSWFNETFDARAQARAVAGLLDRLLQQAAEKAVRRSGAAVGGRVRNS